MDEFLGHGSGSASAAIPAEESKFAMSVTPSTKVPCDRPDPSPCWESWSGSSSMINGLHRKEADDNDDDDDAHDDDDDDDDDNNGDDDDDDDHIDDDDDNHNGNNNDIDNDYNNDHDNDRNEDDDHDDEDRFGSRTTLF